MKFSISKKITLILVIFVAILSTVTMGVSAQVIARVNDEHFMRRADEDARVIAASIDAGDFERFSNRVKDVYYGLDGFVTSDDWGSDAFNAYVANYADLAEADEYERLLRQLRGVQDVLDVDCVYTAFIDPTNKKFVYVVDADDSGDACPIGCVDELLEQNYVYLDNPENGLPAYVSNLADYGWLVTAAAPIHDADGEVIGIACVDISMDYVKAQEAAYVRQLALVMLVCSLVLTLIVVAVVLHFETAPLKSLSEAAQRYCAPGEERQTSFKSIEIKNRDEIGDLYQSMVKMEHDIDVYIENLTNTRKELTATRLQADRMELLATKDALTGLRNKLAYEMAVEDIKEGFKRGNHAFGFVIIDLNDLKVINDTYGHERGDVSLRDLSRIIDRSFTHSEAYRIGGDEFCVILEGYDFEHADELCHAFMDKVSALSESADNLEPWKRISAAVGYALFDPLIDDGPDDVFRRADKDMYACKRYMKGDREVR